VKKKLSLFDELIESYIENKNKIRLFTMFDFNRKSKDFYKKFLIQGEKSQKFKFNFDVIQKLENNNEEEILREHLKLPYNKLLIEQTAFTKYYGQLKIISLINYEDDTDDSDIALQVAVTDISKNFTAYDICFIKRRLAINVSGDNKIFLSEKDEKFYKSVIYSPTENHPNLDDIYYKAFEIATKTVLFLLKLSRLSKGNKVEYNKRFHDYFKKPSLEYDSHHLVEINLDKASSIDNKTLGVQESDRVGREKREHSRRGFIRKLKSGKEVWVRSTVVKKGTLGKVIKDYIIV